MKYEMLMLRGLFVASLLVSGLILGNMLISPSAVVQLAANGSTGTAVSAAKTGCAVPPDGLICPRLDS
ncbi:hypothetical protein EC912_102596 [Luteibacter rhizovicinus]|uniref:Uncharacterized protein n=1 Tax=Luteibacter rhizovicinus TaxID=242606 RepID=A0A4R3YUZ5_9GAMM|nr:hypothetical protein [Luteibacter rhizovicinus]TCV96246.1 hypothetical protein EC912_102596 [Luteibacter rhizovicinus]